MDVLESPDMINYYDTLDPKYLDNLQAHRDELVDIFVEGPVNPEDITLSRLITGHYGGNTLDSFRYLSGITSITYMKSDAYNKRIYLFSDQHNNVGYCPNLEGVSLFSNWLEEVLSTTDVFIDVFIETFDKGIALDTFMSKTKAPIRDLSYDIQNWQARGEMVNTVKLLYNCFRLEGKDCPYPARVHFTDIRPSVMNLFKNLRYKPSIDHDVWEFDEESTRYLHHLIPSKSEYLHRLFDTERIQSQISNIDPTWHRAIEDFILDEADNIGDIYRYDNEFMRFYSLQTDYYTLLRMFRNYDKMTDKWQPTTANNIIVYMGSKHIELYRKFLTSVGFDIVFTSTHIEDYDQCVDVSDISLPLFR